MGKYETWRKATEEELRNGSSEMVLVSVENVAVTNMPLNWKGLRIALFNSPLFNRAITEANPNLYSTLLKIITDGETDEADENIFLTILNMLGMTFSIAEKAELNKYFTDNNFTIRL